MDISKELTSSIERLNILWHVHNENKNIMENCQTLYEMLEKNPGQTLHPDQLIEFLSVAVDKMQTIDGILHVARKHFCKEAEDFAANTPEETAIAIREKITEESEPMKQMLAIMSETEEERVQRFLMEMLDLHE